MRQINDVIKEGFESENSYGRHFCCVTRFAMDGTAVYCDLLKSGTHKILVETR